jgi:hypothetical protein
MGALLSIGIKGKDGKFKNYTISISDTPDKFGQNVSMFEEQSAEQRAAKEPKTYIGNGKVFWTDGKISVPVKQAMDTVSSMSANAFSNQLEDDGLPF